MFDENYDPALFDGIVDFDPDQMCIDDDSSEHIQTIEEWLSSPFVCAFDEEKDCCETSSSDVLLERKEWLVRDSLSKRYRAPRLFEFLVLLLRKVHYQSYASFTDRARGVFQVHQPEKVAALWQAVKSRQSNQKMTYDKFARAIRWYYKSNIMQKTNTRYTFQFSPKTFRTYFLDENNNSIVHIPA